MKHICHKNFDSKNIMPILVKSAIISLCIYIGANTVSDNISNNSNYSIVQKIEDYDVMTNYLNTNNITINSKKSLPLMYAISINNKLTEKEKNTLYKLETLIDENSYIDYESAYNNLINLQIEYVERPDNIDKTILAIYSYKNNTISVYQPKEEANFDIILHEFVHVLFTNDKTINLPDYLLEGTTELLTNEYLSNNSFVEKNTYPFEVTMVKILCEMIGTENVLKTYATGNINHITSSLKDDPKNNKEFMNNIQDIFNSFSNHENISPKKYNDVILFMDDYFYTNYKDDNSKINRYEYYKGIINLIYDDKPYKKHSEYLKENGVVRKAYFSNKLKKEYPKSETMYLPKVKTKKVNI